MTAKDVNIGHCRRVLNFLVFRHHSEAVEDQDQDQAISLRYQNSCLIPPLLVPVIFIFDCGMQLAAAFAKLHAV